jgi:hypothetical protein
MTMYLIWTVYYHTHTKSPQDSATHLLGRQM